MIFLKIISNRYIKKNKFNIFLTIINCLIFIPFYSQNDSPAVITVDFNNHNITEKNNKIIPKPVGVVLTYDRFGNKESALQLFGASNSYLNLGISKLMKNSNMSISLWVKMNNRVFVGKGTDFNPILFIKNGPGDDFINAIIIDYDCATKRLGVNSTKDSTNEVIILDNDSISFNKWYHLVAICNNEKLAFYIDGKLITKSNKNFETKFTETDSVMIGHSASIKNERYMRGVIDDIKFYHRELSEKEIIELFTEPNPNEFNNKLFDFIKYISIIFILVIVIITLIFRSKYLLKKQKKKLELNNKISELELKVVKAQMNPHFISNCLSAIQDLVLKKNYEKSALYLAKFSYFLRKVLFLSEYNFIALSDEIEMINLYIELEKLRFDNIFLFELNLEDNLDCDQISVPSLITQSFIENAIWHGLLPLNNLRQAMLKINIYSKNDTIIIEIEDNGMGRSDKKKLNKTSLGNKLVLDKLTNLNRIAGKIKYEANIIDLYSIDNKQIGTKIILYISL